MSLASFSCFAKCLSFIHLCLTLWCCFSISFVRCWCCSRLLSAFCLWHFSSSCSCFSLCSAPDACNTNTWNFLILIMRQTSAKCVPCYRYCNYCRVTKCFINLFLCDKHNKHICFVVVMHCIFVLCNADKGSALTFQHQENINISRA